VPVYPGTSRPSFRPSNTIQKEGFRETHLSFDSHTGTHIDAPEHMLENGNTLDRLPVDHFKGIGFDTISADPAESNDYLNHIKIFEKNLIITENLVFPDQILKYSNTQILKYSILQFYHNFNYIC